MSHSVTSAEVGSPAVPLLPLSLRKHACEIHPRALDAVAGRAPALKASALFEAEIQGLTQRGRRPGAEEKLQFGAESRSVAGHGRARASGPRLGCVRRGQGYPAPCLDPSQLPRRGWWQRQRSQEDWTKHRVSKSAGVEFLLRGFSRVWARTQQEQRRTSASLKSSCI